MSIVGSVGSIWRSGGVVRIDEKVYFMGTVFDVAKLHRRRDALKVLGRTIFIHRA